jgi:hypothetical protein
MELYGLGAAAAMPLMEDHLDKCRDCREEFGRCWRPCGKKVTALFVVPAMALGQVIGSPDPGNPEPSGASALK